MRCSPSIALAVLAAVACGGPPGADADADIVSDGGPPDPGQTDPRPRDGGSADSEVTPFDAGPAWTACPETPPADGSPCVGLRHCGWLECGSYGEARAACDGSGWVSSAAPCDGTSCRDADRCLPGEVCVHYVTGVINSFCVPGLTGLVTCERGCGSGRCVAVIEDPDPPEEFFCEGTPP